MSELSKSVYKFPVDIRVTDGGWTDSQSSVWANVGEIVWNCVFLSLKDNIHDAIIDIISDHERYRNPSH